MIWRVRDRATFGDLRRRGVRARRGAVMVTYLPDPARVGSPPRVAFALGRRVGSAVVRNRIRRRLRAAIADLAAREPELVGPGAWLLSGQPGAEALPYRELARDLEAAVRAARARAGA